MRNLIKVGLPIVAFAAVGLLLTSEFKPKQTQNTNPEKPANSSVITVNYNCEKGKNAFELLEASNKVKSQDSSFGKMVTSINDFEQGGGKYWLYFVDDKEATISASTYICQDNEKIKWELK